MVEMVDGIARGEREILDLPFGFLRNLSRVLLVFDKATLFKYLVVKKNGKSNTGRS